MVEEGGGVLGFAEDAELFGDLFPLFDDGGYVNAAVFGSDFEQFLEGEVLNLDEVFFVGVADDFF